ncbi:MAG: hypothetical protein HFH24_12010 [Ruminococcus sp.]|nr:hypothetical protein [Ruminococcus sp.]
MRHYYDYDYYDYADPTSMLDSMAMGIILACVAVLFLVLIFSLISYILKGIGMYTIAKRQGREYGWLAFIPFARTYLHGELAGSIRLKKRTIQNPGIWLLALPFIYGAVYSVLYAVIWFLGFGAIMRMSDTYYFGQGPHVGTGTLLGVIILLLLFSLIVVVYTAVYKTLSILVNHQILERFTSKNMSIVHAILCSVIPLYESICLFVMRNKPFNPGMGPVMPPPFMQTPPPGPYGNGPESPQGPPCGYPSMGSGSVPPERDMRETASWDASEIPLPPVSENTAMGSTESLWKPVENRVDSTQSSGSSSNTGSLFDSPSGMDTMSEQQTGAGSLFDVPSGTDTMSEQQTGTGSLFDVPSGTDAVSEQQNGTVSSGQESDQDKDAF